MSSDGQDRTEKATPQRMKEVRGKGQLQRSQDLSAWVGLAAAAIAIPAVLAGAQTAATHQLMAVRNVAAEPSTGVAVKALDDGLGSLLGILTPMFALVVVVTVAGTFLDEDASPGAVLAYLLFVTLAVIVLVLVSVAKGPSPRWRWGPTPDDPDDPDA